MNIGQEFTVFGWCKNKTLLNDEQLLQVLLSDICSAIDMRPLAMLGVNVPLELEKANALQFEDEGGSSASAIATKFASLVLSTSHAHIHGWPEREDREDGGFFWFSVGSCRTFDADKVDELLTKTLHVTHSHKSQRWVSIVDGEFKTSDTQPIAQG
jgi:S-adenosylmethionine/arginine decarboxylase-like enzyme